MAMDTESYPNYWLYGQETPEGVVQIEIRGENSRLSESDRNYLLDLLDTHPIWSFNGEGYDKWLIAGTVAGYTAGQLYMLTKKIIEERVKPWMLGIPRYDLPDHIDIMEVIPGNHSQKYYAGMIHYKTMRDLPIAPGTVLTEAEIDEVREYHRNDMGQLAALAAAVSNEVKMREALSARYGIDVRSKSDAQAAEAIIVAQCEKALGRKIGRTSPDFNLTFRYDAPEWLRFTRPELNEILRIATSATYGLSAAGALILPPSMEGYTITIGRSAYKIGIGGLHSQEKGASHYAGDTHVIRDVDVDSYYPSLMLRAGAYPEALGPQFLVEFAAIREDRLDAKARQAGFEKKKLAGVFEAAMAAEYGDVCARNAGGKIMINGTFGKTGSIWSKMFAPKMTIQTTVTGQLALLMLIELFENAGLSVISANTDGVVVMCPNELEPMITLCVKEWENRTGLTMEANDYKSIHSIGVNSYMAVYKNKHKVKRKGDFAPTSLLFKKSPDGEICADACAAYVLDGTPIEQTVFGCTDIRKFVHIANVTGGAVKMHGDGPRGELVREMMPRLERFGWVKRGRGWVNPFFGCPDPIKAGDAFAMTFPPMRAEELAKRIRYYFATGCPGPIVYGPHSRKPGALVPDSWGAKPCMVLPDSLPFDIDYARYIERAKRMLRDAGIAI